MRRAELVKWSLAIVVVLGLLSAYFVLARSSAPDSQQSLPVAAATYPEITQLPRDESVAVPRDEDHFPLRRAERVEWKRKSGYAWDPLDPGIAADQFDADWLNNQGYPDGETYRELMMVSVDQLARMARQGDKSAVGVLAYRLAKAAEDPAKVEQILLDGAARGSMYSLKAASDVYTSVDSFRHLPTAYAYNSLRLRSGDQTALGDNLMISSGFSHENYLEAQLIEAALALQLESRNARYFSQLGPPRPGYEEFIRSTLKRKEGL